VAWYMMGSAAVSVLALVLLAETLRRDISSAARANAATPSLS
jgi:hypothetical protein